VCIFLNEVFDIRYKRCTVISKVMAMQLGRQTSYFKYSEGKSKWNENNKNRYTAQKEFSQAGSKEVRCWVRRTSHDGIYARLTNRRRISTLRVVTAAKRQSYAQPGKNDPLFKNLDKGERTLKADINKST